jgi:hypothetical protein
MLRNQLARVVTLDRVTPRAGRTDEINFVYAVGPATAISGTSRWRK